MAASWANCKSKKKKIYILKCHLLLTYATTSNFSIGLWRAMTSGFYTTTSDDQLSDWTKKKFQSTSQSQLAPKTGSWSLFGDLLLFWATIVFWIPGKPFHLKSMLSESMRCTENFLVLVTKKGPILLHYNAWLHIVQPILQKLNELGYEVLPHPPCLPDLLPTNYHFFKHLDNFLQGIMLSQPAGGRKCFPRVWRISMHGFLCYRNKQTYFSLTNMHRL